MASEKMKGDFLVLYVAPYLFHFDYLRATLAAYSRTCKFSF